MNKNARKLIPAVAMLLVSATMLSTASFAWFSMNSQVEATGMQVQVNAPGSIVISGDNTNWDSTYEFTTPAVTLGHASSSTGVEFFAIDPGSIAVDGTPNADAVVEKVAAAENAENHEDTYSNHEDTYSNIYGVAGAAAYAEYSFWLATTSASDMNVTLDSTATMFSAEGESIASTDALAPALRFAVLTGDPTPAVDSNQDEGTGNVWFGATNQPYSAEERPYITAGPVAEGQGQATNATDTEQFVAGETLLKLTASDNEGTAVGTAVKVTIRIWLEGTDAAAINANILALKTFDLKITFTQANA